ncbi:unnamed protein product [Chironomus riparius]|uniref:CCDC66 domain-containing protein n=1 Tax=Chironomus riparius TaxID=315576 RepID=A0A9N9RX73_9DIPT|nr:unnamed protein product [Chironomus riparius]
MIIKDHKDSINRELSLVEQKKIQWAKEREEMAKLEQYHSKLASKYERNTIRTQLITNTEIVHQNNNFHQKNNFNMRRIRSPSLPPIDRYDKGMTRQGSNNSDQSSGYLSGSGGSSLPPNALTLSAQNQYEFNYGETHFDTVGNNSQNTGHPKQYSMTSSSLNEYPSSSNNERDVEFDVVQKPIGTPSSESSVTSQDIFSVSSYANSSTIDSSLNYQKSREGRAKWGSYLFDSFAKDNNGRSSRNTNGPVWLEKSLSEARDSEEETMSISVHSVSSFLRGQNAPVDAYILAERESKRRKAMELQQAIKEQLEEREKIKRLERERQWQQEKLEEERLSRQMDIEKQRLEKEQKFQNEKLENERKKEETMKKALEKAALEAQMERERKRREKALALQSSLDETISIQKIGERTEICIEGFQKPLTVDVTKEVPVKDDSSNNLKAEESTPSKSTSNDQSDNNNNDEYDEDEDDGETILIGTPIKLKKKNLETFRRKFNKRQQNADNDVKTSDEEMSTPKTIKSTESVNNEKNTTKSQAKSISDLEGIAIVLQTMPLVPFVPLTNEMFGFNQLNNLAFLMATQNRLGSPNVMLPLISRDISTPSSNEKLDLSQFIIPQNNNQSTITLQIQQVDNTKQVILNDNKITSIPPTPDVNNNNPSYENSKSQEIQNNESLTGSAQQVAHENFKTSIPNSPPIQLCSTPSIPHDGTFTKEESSFSCHDACTSTINENNCYSMKENEIKILTPQKYRVTLPATTNEASKTVATQTESFLFCEFCSHQYHNILTHQRCSHLTVDNNNNNNNTANGNNMNSNNVHNDVMKPKDKKNEDRPKWGVRNPPIKYLKASERDPFYGKSRKKRYLKKAASESEKNDDSCTYKDCPLVKSPLLSRRCNKLQNRENLCSNLLPIKTDRFGRICLVDEQNFIMKEAMKRVPYYTSDTESSIDMKQRSFFLPKANDFQDIFID